MKKVLLGLIIGLFGFSFAAKGQVLVNLASKPNGLTFGGGLAFSKVEYELTKNDYTWDTDRKTFGLGIASSLDRNCNLLFQAAYTFESEFDDSEWDGTGYMLGGGANFFFYRGHKINFLGYAFLNYINEQYEYTWHHHKMDADLTLMDIHLGTFLYAQASPHVALYIGPDFVVYSKGEVQYGKEDGQDFKRHDMLNFKAGMNVQMDNVSLRPEVTFIGEQTITLTLDFNS